VRERRYEAHLHSASGTWYCYDHLAGEPVATGFALELEAWELAIDMESEFSRSCRAWKRQERAAARAS